MVLKLHVKLMTDNGGIHSEFVYGGNVYIKVEPPVYLTLECVGESWSKDKCIIITQNSIYTIIQNMKKLQENGFLKRVGADKNGHWEIE
jgi:hypothetical protein